MDENTSMPRIGQAAPMFQANTTRGPINFPTDYSGRWIILFSHPSDFTPVCTSEFVMFGSLQDEFEAMNCQLVGLSVDGVASHTAWIRSIRERISFNGHSNVDIQFPIIDDVSMKVSRLYGMLHPDESETQAVRAVFFIDPKGIIRAVIYYPLKLGRNFDEIKRVLEGLQTIDAFGVALPADWHPGDAVIDPNPTDLHKIDERWARSQASDSKVKCYDWYFCTSELPADEIDQKLKK